jgi:hypothetical protein
MPVPTRPLAVTAAAGLALWCSAAAAQVFGSLANFDAVNDTGYRAHGFEIQIDDPRFGDPGSNLIQSIFGYDRNFGVPPASVERYGAPQVLMTPGVGVLIRYQASFVNGAWTTGTPSGPYPNAGDSCWPLGNPQYASGLLSCDHFGVGTYGTPASTQYRWLVDTAAGDNSGLLTPIAAGVPPVVFNYVAAVPPAQPGGAGEPARVEAEVHAPRDDARVVGSPFWVKIFAKHLDHGVELDHLMQGHADVPGEAEVEAEFATFQAGGENEVSKALLNLDANDQALVLRFEFYRYIGALKADGSVDCSGKGGNRAGPESCGGLGGYVGAQMAGFNLVQDPLPAGVLPPVAVVPEPGTWALWLGGLGALALRRRQAYPMQKKFSLLPSRSRK